MIRLSLLLCALAGPVLAQDDIRPPDAVRLAEFDAAAGAALLQAMAAGGRGDVDLLQEVLSGVPLAPIATTLPGDWACRTLKLGKTTPLTIYAPFACTITADGAGFRIDKNTGSQQLTGYISLDEHGMILTGVGHVADTPPPAYADLPDDFVSDGTVWPIIGRVEQTAPDRVRILMPRPALESDFDILSLTRDAAPEN